MVPDGKSVVKKSWNSQILNLRTEIENWIFVSILYEFESLWIKMNSKRTHLSLEIKHSIVLEKKRKPKISQTELVWEVNRKFGVSTSRRAIRTALNSKNIEAGMVNATKAGKNERELSRRSGLILNHFWIRTWKKIFETKSKCRKNCKKKSQKLQLKICSKINEYDGAESD